MSRLALALAFLFFLVSGATAQLAIKPDLAAGGGLMFAGNEDAVFSTRSLYGAVHWNGLHLPWLDSSTGIGVELHPATVALDGGIVSADYRVWSLNRVEGPSVTYGGTDLKIGQGGEGGWVADFDQRIVFGVHVAELGSAKLNLELYALEDDRPVSACFLVRWGGTSP